MTNESWRFRPIGELFEISAGKAMSAAARNADQKTPFLRTSNVLWDEIDLTTVDEMAISMADLAAKHLRPGDLLVCEGGEVGRAAVWNGEVEVMSFQNHLHRLRPLAVDDVDPRFYVYFLQSAFTQLGIFEGAGNKTTIPNLSRNRLAALQVPHPALDEQQDIVAVLGRVRDAIRLHKASAELSKVLKRAAMDAVFTHGLRGEPQKESVLGPLPRNWQVTTLGSVASLSTGTTPSTKRLDYYKGAAPFIKTAEIVNNRIHTATTLVSPEAITEYGLKMYKPGTVLMAMYGQGKTRGQVAILEIAATTSQNAAAIEPHDCIDGVFLWQYLLSKYDHLRGMGSLGHLSHLNLGYLRDLYVLCPPLEEQQEVASVLNVIDRKINLHRRKGEVLGELFKALLRRLMTGEVRVADLDPSALEATSTAAVEAA